MAKPLGVVKKKGEKIRSRMKSMRLRLKERRDGKMKQKTPSRRGGRVWKAMEGRGRKRKTGWAFLDARKFSPLSGFYDNGENFHVVRCALCVVRCAL
ncbi:MAG: hypothetical protein LBR88_01115, partial [Zoogloeaceae bacterium]|nr:hypothetical protein [Zoogloeaceae bacterium]